MTKGPEGPKRRGRPRLADEKRKRHTMTFRMRTELRSAVEEIAQSYGRSLSEQIEYYVESSVDLEVGRLHKYSSEGISDALLSFVKNSRKFRENDMPRSEVQYGSVRNPMKETAHQSDVKPLLVWALDPSNQAGAIDMVRRILAATRMGTIEALSEMLTPENVQLLLAEETGSEAAAQARSENGRLGVKLAETLTSVGELSSLPIGGRVAETSAVRDYSILALTTLLSRLTDRSPDLSPIAAASWPRRFMSLPPDTRALLIRVLKPDAASVYEDLVRLERSRSPGEPLIRPDIARGIRLAALKRMQHALLPRREDENEDEYNFGAADDDGIDD